ncbi:hypothetical protein NQD34_016477 [Periophthalmus magnuspinnatus]|nr:hypothetical protein NQD34_016477 [Periophthalmus magnuspinnatus]
MGEGVPELGSRAAEGSAPHSDKTGRRDSEVQGRGGAEGAGRCGDVNEVRQVWRGQVVESFVCEEYDFVVYAVRDGEPVELLQDRCDVVMRGCVCDNAGS